MRRCHSDVPKARTKGKELELYQALQQNGVQFEYQRYVAFAGCGLVSETKHAFLDFLIPQEWGYVVLECDEEAHRAYDASCDPRRDFGVAAAVELGSAHKLRVIRYNPDAYKVDGVTRKVSKAARIERLLATLRRPEPTGSLERLFLYYDECSELPGLPAVAEHWPEEVRAVSALG
jgi:hypothetical protein